MNSHVLWYLTRGSGIVALILLTASVILGLTTRNRWSSQRFPRFVVENLHKNISLMSVVFLAVHISTAVLDSYVSIRWIDTLVPFIGTYKPMWLGLGALALDCFIAVAVTSMVRVRLGYRAWRGVHWMAYGCWGIALAHGFGIGSDRSQAWMLGLDLAAVVGVTAALVWRVSASLRQPEPILIPATVRPRQGASR